ncbi:hypothetical protein FGB62_258g07 [Gracilaria domingensis]|nr:hypothetical protein FGB62_258g07 [Gracilaria domingensis]
MRRVIRAADHLQRRHIARRAQLPVQRAHMRHAHQAVAIARHHVHRAPQPPHVLQQRPHALRLAAEPAAPRDAQHRRRRRVAAAVARRVAAQREAPEAAQVVRARRGVLAEEQQLREQPAVRQEALRREREPQRARHGRAPRNRRGRRQHQRRHLRGAQQRVLVRQVRAQRVAEQRERPEREAPHPLLQRLEEEVERVRDVLAVKARPAGRAPAGQVRHEHGREAHLQQVVHVAEERRGRHAVPVQQHQRPPPRVARVERGRARHDGVHLRAAGQRHAPRARRPAHVLQQQPLGGADGARAVRGGAGDEPAAQPVELEEEQRLAGDAQQSHRERQQTHGGGRRFRSGGGGARRRRRRGEGLAPLSACQCAALGREWKRARAARRDARCARARDGGGMSARLALQRARSPPRHW